MPKHLIVNADDFGLSDGVNRGIIEAAEAGILTSASLMVRQPAAAGAAIYSRTKGGISVGLHLDLGEWFVRDGEWLPLYSVVPTDDAEAVGAEVTRQLTEFRRLLGRNPTHLDSHQHVHRNEPVLSIARDLAKRLNIPLRDFTPGIGYCGDFYGQTAESEHWPEGISLPNLKKILAGLPEGITELGCHPGYGDGLATAYRVERAMETKALCDPALRGFLKEFGVQLCSFELEAVKSKGGRQ
jgi:predicted glycoside hydrolase/deacetylase ChbG (UPF0249 family)